MSKKSIVSVAASGMLALAMAAAPVALRAQASSTVLKPAAMKGLMPARVFYGGQMTTTQLRNSGGIKCGGKFYVLASLVDTSGYSSEIAAKFQGYFITEIPILVNGMKLGAGEYGIGFIAGNKFVVTDVGGHDVLTVNSATDTNLKRPRPLEVVAASPGKFRLYIGRKYVVLSR